MVKRCVYNRRRAHPTYCPLLLPGKPNDIQLFIELLAVALLCVVSSGRLDEAFHRNRVLAPYVCCAARLERAGCEEHAMRAGSGEALAAVSGAAQRLAVIIAVLYLGRPGAVGELA